MSEHKKVGIVGSTSKGMATTGKKAPLRFAHFRLWLVCAAGLLLVAATVCTVWLVHHHDARSTHISTEQVMSPSEVHAKASLPGLPVSEVSQSAYSVGDKPL
jgi:hypothetical protein